MEFEVQTPLFKNASLRKEFLNRVIEAFEAAQNHAELICLYQEFEPTFIKMETSGEYDQLALQCIQARYKALHVRHEEDKEYIQRALDAYERERNI